MSSPAVRSVRVIPIGTTPETAPSFAEYDGRWGDGLEAALAAWRKTYGGSWQIHRHWVRGPHLYLSLRPRRFSPPSRPLSLQSALPRAA
jgi:hypothetical protein